jgi:hypothetical protein
MDYDISRYIQPYNPPPIFRPYQSLPIPQNNHYDGVYMIGLATIIVGVIYIIYKYYINNNISKFYTDSGSDSDSDSDSDIKKMNRVDHLTNCGWELYASKSCHWCSKQIDILNTHFPNFRNVYYDKPVEAVPTWYNPGLDKTVTGFQTYDQLMKLSCFRQ